MVELLNQKMVHRFTAYIINNSIDKDASGFHIVFIW